MALFLNIEEMFNLDFSAFYPNLYFREDRDSEIAPTREEKLEHQVRTTRQLNGSGTL